MYLHVTTIALPSKSILLYSFCIEPVSHMYLVSLVTVMCSSSFSLPYFATRQKDSFSSLGRIKVDDQIKPRFSRKQTGFYSRKTLDTTELGSKSFKVCKTTNPPTCKHGEDFSCFAASEVLFSMSSKNKRHGKQMFLSVSVTKNQRNSGHGQKSEFPHTLSVCRARQVTERYGVSFLKYSI